MSAALAELCKGRWPDILRSLGLLSSAALAGRDQPCPTCGGHDRFRFTDKGYGRWFCRGCGMGGDGLRLVQVVKRVDFQTAASLVETVVGKVAESGAGKKTDKAKPSDPLKPWREAGALSRRLAGRPILPLPRAHHHRDRGAIAALRCELVSLAIKVEMAGDRRPDHPRRRGRRSAVT